MRLVIGLGNPGRRYRHTRHNIGWEVVERLATVHRIDVRTDEGWAETGRGTIRGQRILLARPQTYMNASGAAVADLRRRHRVLPEDLMVVVDDLDLPVGVLRLREKGSHGGHNGLRSIIEELGTSAFPRLRVGIGRPPEDVDPADYVLERPTADERRLLDDAVAEAAAGIELWIGEGVQAAMRHCNTRPAQETGARGKAL
jgi:PTH1 family peptidyl-tRNA hydrolase